MPGSYEIKREQIIMGQEDSFVDTEFDVKFKDKKLRDKALETLSLLKRLTNSIYQDNPTPELMDYKLLSTHLIQNPFLVSNDEAHKWTEYFIGLSVPSGRPEVMWLLRDIKFMNMMATSNIHFNTFGLHTPGDFAEYYLGVYDKWVEHQKKIFPTQRSFIININDTPPTTLVKGRKVCYVPKNVIDHDLQPRAQNSLDINLQQYNKQISIAMSKLNFLMNELRKNNPQLFKKRWFRKNDLNLPITQENLSKINAAIHKIESFSEQTEPIIKLIDEIDLSNEKIRLSFELAASNGYSASELDRAVTQRALQDLADVALKVNVNGEFVDILPNNELFILSEIKLLGMGSDEKAKLLGELYQALIAAHEKYANANILDNFYQFVKNIGDKVSKSDVEKICDYMKNMSNENVIKLLNAEDIVALRSRIKNFKDLLNTMKNKLTKEIEYLNTRINPVKYLVDFDAIKAWKNEAESLLAENQSEFENFESIKQKLNECQGKRNEMQNTIDITISHLEQTKSKLKTEITQLNEQITTGESKITELNAMINDSEQKNNESTKKLFEKSDAFLTKKLNYLPDSPIESRIEQLQGAIDNQIVKIKHQKTITQLKIQSCEEIILNVQFKINARFMEVSNQRNAINDQIQMYKNDIANNISEINFCKQKIDFHTKSLVALSELEAIKTNTITNLREYIVSNKWLVENLVEFDNTYGIEQLSQPKPVHKNNLMEEIKSFPLFNKFQTDNKPNPRVSNSDLIIDKFINELMEIANRQDVPSIRAGFNYLQNDLKEAFPIMNDIVIQDIADFLNGYVVESVNILKPIETGEMINIKFETMKIGYVYGEKVDPEKETATISGLEIKNNKLKFTIDNLNKQLKTINTILPDFEQLAECNPDKVKNDSKNAEIQTLLELTTKSKEKEADIQKFRKQIEQFDAKISNLELTTEINNIRNELKRNKTKMNELSEMKYALSELKARLTTANNELKTTTENLTIIKQYQTPQQLSHQPSR